MVSMEVHISALCEGKLAKNTKQNHKYITYYESEGEKMMSVAHADLPAQVVRVWLRSEFVKISIGWGELVREYMLW